MSKYDFKGIKKQGASGLKLLLASDPATAWMLKVPFLNFLLEALVNWATNNGLVILNIGAIYVNGKLDQDKLDKAIENGLREVETPGIVLTEERIKEIDDEVIKSARKALPYVRTK